MRGFHLPPLALASFLASFPDARACRSAATRRFCSFFSGLSFCGMRYSSSSKSDSRAAAAAAAAAASASAFSFFSFSTSAGRRNPESVPSRDAMPFGASAEESESDDLREVMGVSSIAVASASASAAESAEESSSDSLASDSTPLEIPSTTSASSSSSSSGSSGSGSAGHSTRKKSPLCWWYHWLYFLSCKTKLMAYGASTTDPEISTFAISFVTPSVSDSTSRTVTLDKGVWHTSESSTVPCGRIAEGGMVHASGALALATPQCNTKSAALSVSTVTLKLTPLDCTSIFTSAGRYSRIAMS